MTDDISVWFRRFLPGTTAFVLVGLLTMTRTFAYMSIHPLSSGEMLLALFIVTSPTIFIAWWYRWMITPSPTSAFAWALSLSLVFGAVHAVRGLLGDGMPMITLENYVSHVYAISLFVGIWVGRTDPTFLPRFIRCLAWCNGIYGTLFLTFLSQGGRNDPMDVDMFGQPGGASLALLGLLCFEKNLSRCWIPLLLNAFVMLGLQMRAEWLGFLAALFVWSVVAGRVGQLAKLAAICVMLLGCAWVVDLRIESPTTRAGEISVRHIVGRTLSAVDPNLAEDYAADAGNYTATVEWRTAWWGEIWKETHSSFLRSMIGPGYGWKMWECHPNENLEPAVRMPHNGLLFALGYTGWVGIGVLLLVHGSIAWALWAVYRRTGNVFGLCYCVLALVWAPFDAYFEVPWRAIPYFLIAGICLAPLTVTAEQEEQSSEELMREELTRDEPPPLEHVLEHTAR